MKKLALMLVLNICCRAEAESFSYGVYKQGKWDTAFGKVPSPPAEYSIPTVDHSLNKTDKSYFCSLVQLSESQCAEVQFIVVSGGISGKSGIIQFGLDMQMTYRGKTCFGTTWKTYQNNNTWVLSNPTAIHGFPHDCEIPQVANAP